MSLSILAGTAEGIHEIDPAGPTGSGGPPSGTTPARPVGPVHLPGLPITFLAVAVRERWAIVDRREIWRSQTDGSWIRAAVVGDHRVNCLLPSPGGALIGTSEAYLLRLDDGTVQPVKAFEHVRGRGEWYTPWGGPPDTRSLSREQEAIYANVHVGGIVRSRDEGTTWEPTIDIHADVHQVLSGPDRGMVLAASADGLCLSMDGGDSWRFDREGLHASYSRAVAVSGNTVLVSASTGPRGKQSAVYRRPLAGDGRFEKCSQGLPDWFDDNVNTHCLVAAEEMSAFGTASGSVFLSTDRGGTWMEIVSGLPAIEALALAAN